MEIDGSIVTLDQEKAYNKICHKYLWETMNQFNLPHPFTSTVKALYQNAFTRVAINGELSTPFESQEEWDRGTHYPALYSIWQSNR